MRALFVGDSKKRKGVLFLQVSEVRSFGKNLVIGEKSYDTTDLFKAQRQSLSIALNATGSVKLGLVVKWRYGITLGLLLLYNYCYYCRYVPEEVYLRYTKFGKDHQFVTSCSQGRASCHVTRQR